MLQFMGSQIVKTTQQVKNNSNLIKMPVTGIQNIPLWHKDYLELNIFEKEQAQENL